jgi:hypothetical protein
MNYASTKKIDKGYLTEIILVKYIHYTMEDLFMHCPTQNKSREKYGTQSIIHEE